MVMAPASPPPQILMHTMPQQQFQSSLPLWKLILFGSLCKAYTNKTLYHMLINKHPIMLVSDASVQNNGQSGFAWVIAKGATPLWQGLGLTPGPEEDMYSGRAEEFGLFVAISFLQYDILCYQPAIPATTIPCYCNNLGVVMNLNLLTATFIVRPNDTTNDGCNIYLTIQQAATACTALKLQYCHVKGHQDANLQHPLMVEEQHNVDCDKLAKKFVHTHPQQSTALAHPEFDIAALHLKIAGKLICHKVLLALWHAAAVPLYWDYLC